MFCVLHGWEIDVTENFDVSPERGCDDFDVLPERGCDDFDASPERGCDDCAYEETGHPGKCQYISNVVRNHLSQNLTH